MLVMRCVGCGSIGEYEQAALAFKSGRPVLWKNNSLQPFNHNPTPLLTKRNTICENVNSPILTQQFIIPAVFNLLKCFLAVCFKSTEIRSIFELNDDSNIRIFRLYKNICETISGFNIGSHGPVSAASQES